jgi:hypothetical protein
MRLGNSFLLPTWVRLFFAESSNEVSKLLLFIAQPQPQQLAGFHKIQHSDGVPFQRRSLLVLW